MITKDSKWYMAIASDLDRSSRFSTVFVWLGVGYFSALW